MSRNGKENFKPKDHAILPKELDHYLKQKEPIVTGAFDLSLRAKEDSTSGADYVREVANEVLEHFKTEEDGNKDKEPVLKDTNVDNKGAENTGNGLKIIEKNTESGLKITPKNVDRGLKIITKKSIIPENSSVRLILPELKDVTDPQEKELLDELIYAKNQLEKTENNQKKAMQEVRKYFKSSESEEKENSDVVYLRGIYENALKKYEDYQANKQKSKASSGLKIKAKDNASFHADNLTIIDNLIRNELDKFEPGENHDAAAELIRIDALKEYANIHKITIDEAMEKLVNNTIKFSITHDSSGLPQAHFNEKIVIKDNIESKDAVTQHNLIHPELRDLLDKYNILNSSNFNERVGTLRKILSNNDFSVFNKLKGIKVADILEGNGGHSIEELPNAESRKIFEQLMKEFPPNSTSKGETMGRWTFEIVKNFEQLLTKNN